MVDLPDNAQYRNAFEARANQIALKFEADGRMAHSQSFDYSVPGQMTVTCKETEEGDPFVFTLTTKTDETFVDRELTKQLNSYDRRQ